MDFLAFIMSAVALIVALGTRSRITTLEVQFRKLWEYVAAGGVQAARQAPEKAQESVEAAAQERTSQERSIEIGERVDDATSSFSDWLKEDWLLKLGALLLLIGIGWFASYAIANNWIGPVGRITLGLLFGVSVMVLGFWRIKLFPSQGDIFLAVGAGIVMLVTFAARSIYDFFDPFSALAFMFITAAFVAAASALFNRRALGSLSVAIAAAAPFLTVSPTADYIGLFMYFAVVLASSLWLAAFKEFRGVATTAMVALFFYSMPALVGFVDHDVRDTLFLFECVFALMIFLSHTLGVKKEGMQGADMFTAGGNATILLWWILTVVPAEIQSIVVAVWALIFAAGSYAVYLKTDRRDPFFLYAGLALVYLGVATALELQGNALVIAYAIEATVLTIASFAFTKDIAIARSTSVLFAIPVLLSVGGIFGTFDGVAFSLLLIMMVTIGGTGFYFRELSLSTNSETNRQWYATLIIIGSLYALIIIWRSFTEVIFPDAQGFGVMCALVVYTFIAIIIYAAGTRLRIPAYRAYGAFLVAFVIGRLFLVEAWEMSLAARTVTFITIGLLLMGTAFTIRKTKTPTKQ